MKQNRHRIWADISLKTIEENYEAIRAHIGGKPVLCVVKADAYGHGAVEVVRRLERHCPAYFGVATVGEAVELRHNGVSTPILILGYVDENDTDAIMEYRITPTVHDEEAARLFSDWATANGGTIECHLAVDTGMSRIGFDSHDPEAAIRAMLEVSRLPGLSVTGIFTHFPEADTPEGEAFTRAQIARFKSICVGLERAGLRLPWKHCANSAGLACYDDPFFDLVRAGIVLYGYQPDPALQTGLNIRPAMTVRARVAQVRRLYPGQSVGYGRTFIAERECSAAVITAGYADGYLRAGSGQAVVEIAGQLCPVRGRICMDMCMAELPDGLEVRHGDEVVLFGPGAVTADTVAQAAGTISYEVLCAVSKRVPRFYEDDVLIFRPRRDETAAAEKHFRHEDETGAEPTAHDL